VAGDGVPALETRRLTKFYGDLVAVDAVDVVVPSGSVFGLLGPNGAGKTTLMRMAFGLVQPTSGEVFTLGRSFARDGIGALDGVAGFVETPRFYPYLSGRENLQILHQLDGGGGNGSIDGALETVDLASRGRDRVRSYSYGMVQRLGVAAALLRRPRLLVVDEPTNGLDPAGIREMRALIERLAGTGLTVLLSSHNMTEVAELCDRVAIMSRGRIVFQGTMADLEGQAEEPVYVLRTTDQPAAYQIAAGTAGVAGVASEDGQIVLAASESGLTELTTRLGRLRIGITHLAARETPLETLFFRLTGHGDLYAESHPDSAEVAV
jgi:ABC-2 type transport system ATP-binding protein